jgi:hypothetical protein
MFNHVSSVVHPFSEGVKSEREVGERENLPAPAKLLRVLLQRHVKTPASSIFQPLLSLAQSRSREWVLLRPQILCLLPGTRRAP